MTRGRFVLVVSLPFAGWPLRGYASASFLAHVLLGVALTVASAIRPSRIPSGDVLVVEVVAGVPLPGPRATAPAAPAPPVPLPPAPAPPPREASVEELRPKKEERVPKEPPVPPTERPPSTAPATAGPTVPGAPATAGGPPSAAGAAGEGITSLDLEDAEFAWYRASVTAALRSRWTRPVLEDTLEPIAATVAFEVRRDGSVQNVRIESGSGVPVMDRSVLRAVVEAAPLPPLPSSWREPTLSARFEFRWRPGDPE